MQARSEKVEVAYLPEKETVAERLAALLREGDIVFTMGAGDVTTFGPKILDALANKEI